jgi:hypothetical protein
VKCNCCKLLDQVFFYEVALDKNLRSYYNRIRIEYEMKGENEFPYELSLNLIGGAPIQTTAVTCEKLS